MTSSRNSNPVENPVEKIEIPLNRKTDAIHVLLGAGWGHEEKDGVEFAHLNISYTDGSTDGAPIFIGEDVVDWNPVGSAAEPTRSKLVWKGQKKQGYRRRLSEFVWINPNPDKEIKSLEIVSRNTKAVPFISGVTLK